MLAPNSSASGPPGAKLGRGSSPAIGVSLVFVAGDAQATAHTSSASAQEVGFTCLSFAKPLLAYPSASHAARCVACHGVRSHAVPVVLVGECSIPVV